MARFLVKCARHQTQDLCLLILVMRLPFEFTDLLRGLFSPHHGKIQMIEREKKMIQREPELSFQLHSYRAYLCTRHMQVRKAHYRADGECLLNTSAGIVDELPDVEQNLYDVHVCQCTVPLCLLSSSAALSSLILLQVKLNSRPRPRNPCPL